MEMTVSPHVHIGRALLCFPLAPRVLADLSTCRTTYLSEHYGILSINV